MIITIHLFIKHKFYWRPWNYHRKINENSVYKLLQSLSNSWQWYFWRKKCLVSKLACNVLKVLYVVLFLGTKIIIFSIFCSFFFLAYGQTSNCPEGFRYSNVSNCSNYFVCHNGVPVERHCGLNLLFDCLNKACLLTTHRICCHDGVHDIRSTSGCLLLGRKVPNQEDCHKYYQCVAFRFVERICPTGQNFDQILHTCLPVSQTRCQPGSNSTKTA